MLMSWKAIAAFFNRDVRTLQRWEREQGLPVHRHQHNRQSSVYAYRAELEAWWSQHQSLEEAPVPARRILWEAAGRLGAYAILAIAAIALSTRSRVESTSRFSVQRFAAGAGERLIHSVADINGDGLGDLLTGGASGNELRVYLGRSTVSPRAADLRLATPLNADLTGGVVGDVDGDGIADLVLTTLLKEPRAYSETGPSYLVRGRQQWPAVLELPRDADATFAVDLPGDIRMGPCVERPVDLNADGLNDVVLGAPDFSPSGRRSAGGVFVLFGRRAWPSRIDVLAGADVSIHGSRTGEGLEPRCGTGDFNGDRKPDLALTASEMTMWELRGGRGRVYVVAGRDQWPRVLDLDQQAALTMEGTAASSELATPILADVNGDGFDDLIVGVVSGRPGRPRGRVGIVLGRPSHPARISLDETDVSLSGADRANEFGEAIAARDLNGDGRVDLIVSDPGRGLISLFLGREHWKAGATSAADRPVDLVSGEIGAGAFKMVLGDYDGDGAMELAFFVHPRRSGSRRPDRAGLLTPYLPLAIDIRPAASPNVLLRAGVLAVGVSAAGSPAFADLDHGTLRLAGQAPTHMAWRDFNQDGVADLQLYFDAAALTVRDDVKRLALVGRTRHGVPVAGADDVTVPAVNASARR
jgi:hypothetical protein